MGGLTTDFSQVETKEPRLAVFMSKAYSEPIQNPYWYVDVIVTRENKHFVVDDVVFLKDDWDEESRLSEDLAVDCDGSRWVGHGDERKVE
jgi:hypothetical protein